MRVLITTIGHQDPLADHTVDYKDPAKKQKKDMGRLLERIKQPVPGNELPEGVQEGPILSALRSMALEDGAAVDVEECPELGEPWVPEEIWLVYQPEPVVDSPLGPQVDFAPIRTRVTFLRHCFQRLPRYETFSRVVVRSFPMSSSVYDYVACWGKMEQEFLRVLNSPEGEPPDVRILFGSGPNSVRIALFVLYCMLKPGVAQLWHLFDRNLVGAGDPSAYPLRFGPNGLPVLGDVAACREEIQYLRYELETLRSSGSERPGSAKPVADCRTAEDFRRERAQAIVDRLLSDRDAPIWNKSGKLVKSRLEKELARELAKVNDPVSARTLPLWFANGKKTADNRGPLYLLLPPDPRRPL